MMASTSSRDTKPSAASRLDPTMSTWRPAECSTRDVIQHPMPGLPPERWIGKKTCKRLGLNQRHYRLNLSAFKASQYSADIIAKNGSQSASQLCLF